MTVAVLAGCAALPGGTPQEAVRERAQARWDLLVKGEVRQTYEFFSPGTKSVVTPESYVTSIRQGFWKGAKVDKVVCETRDSCDAHIIIEYDHRGMRVNTPLRETWVREGSEWWLVKK